MVARSRQSRAILDVVHRLDHPTADEVFAAVRQDLPRISLATVYRNLGRFIDDGDIAVREIGGQKRYDPNTTQHVHLHDEATDRLVDVPMTPALEAALADLCEHYLEETGECIIELKGRLKEPTHA